MPTSDLQPPPGTRSAEPLSILTQASRTLLESRDIATVLARILGASQQLIAADGYAVWRARGHGAEWKILAAEGLSAEFVARPAPTPADNSETILPLVAEDITREPQLAHRHQALVEEGIRSMLAVPLIIDGQTCGTIVFYYRQQQSFAPSDVDHALALANLAAAALHTSELHQAQQVEKQRLSFLAEASELLASSLDYETTLRRVAQLAVPHIADWCSVVMVEDGRLARLAVAHADPEKLKMAEEFSRLYPERLDPDRGAGLVLRTGQPQLYPTIPDQTLVDAACDEEHLRMLRGLRLTSVIFVPLLVRGKAIGLLRLISAESGRVFTQDDLELARDLARRAAVAVDNARLYYALSESESRFRSLVEQSPISTVVYDQDGHQVDANPAFDRLWGFSPKELPAGYTAFQDDRLEAAGVLPALFRGFQGKSIQLPSAHVPLDPASSHPQKNAFWMRPTIYPVRDAAGAVTRVVLLQEDVSDRIEAQQAQRDSEERLRLSYSVAKIGSWSWDLVNERLFWSQEFKAMHGLAADAQPSRELGLSLVHPDDRAYVMEEMERYLTSAAEEFSVEHRALCPDGVLRWVHSRSRIQRDAEGRAIGLLGVSIDLTERREAEEALRRSEQRYRTLIAASAAITWTTDPEGRFVEPQPGWSEFTGQTWEQSRGFGWLQVIHPEDRPRIAAAWATAIEQKSRNYEIGGRVWSAARQEYRHYIVRAVPLLEADGSVREWVGTTTDVHEQRQAEEALRRTEKLAAAGRLAATVAHEINNPLESVTNLVYLAAHHPRLPESVREHLGDAEDELKRVAQIVRQTLGFYRESATPRPTDIAEAARDILKLYERRAAAKGVSLTLTCDAAIVATVVSGEIRQVIANLLANAIDAADESGAVQVALQETESGVSIAIIDNGCGIADQHRHRLFEPFFTTKKDVGTGLGLWVTKGIVDKYHGAISVISSTALGTRGSTFTVTLPRLNPADADSPAESIPGEVSARQSI